MIAHVGGVPVEELLPLAPAFAAGAGLLLVRARALAARLVRRRTNFPSTSGGRTRSFVRKR
jgi:hypothetical protein